MNDNAPGQSNEKAAAASSLWAVLWHPKARALYKILIAVAVLVVLYQKGLLDFSRFKRENLHLGYIAAAGLMLLLVFPVVSWRFHLILNSVGLEATYPRALQWTMIGEFFSTALPTATGGDLVKAVYAAQAYGKGRRSVAVLAVLTDRAVGLFGLVTFTLLVCLVGWRTVQSNPKLTTLTLWLVGVCGVMWIGFWVMIQSWVERSSWRKALMGRLPLGDKLEQVYVGLCEMRRHGWRLALVLGLSLANHFLLCSILLVLARGLGMELSVMESAVVIPLCMFLNTFGFAGGFGAGELAFEVLFRSMLGAPEGAGTALAFAFHVLSAGARVLCGLPFYIMAGKPSASLAAGIEKDESVEPPAGS